MSELIPLDEKILNRILHLLLQLQIVSKSYMGICLNARCGAPYHPHWDDNFWEPYNLQHNPIATNSPPHYNDVGIDPTESYKVHLDKLLDSRIKILGLNDVTLMDVTLEEFFIIRRFNGEAIPLGNGMILELQTTFDYVRTTAEE
jgi:hypothetical protein